MENSIEKKAGGFWWSLLILGLLFIGIGIFILFKPFAGYAVLAWLFGFSFIVSGIISIIMSIAGRDVIRYWGWYLIWGVIGVLLGCYMLWNISAAEAVLYLVFAVWLFLQGIFLISHSLSLSKVPGSGWGWALTGGILTLLISLVVMFHPVIGVLTLIIWMGIGILFAGISTVGLAISSKKYLKQ